MAGDDPVIFTAQEMAGKAREFKGEWASRRRRSGTGSTPPAAPKVSRYAPDI
jgi:hypothetical protein